MNAFQKIENEVRLIGTGSNYAVYEFEGPSCPGCSPTKVFEEVAKGHKENVVVIINTKKTGCCCFQTGLRDGILWVCDYEKWLPALMAAPSADFRGFYIRALEEMLEKEKYEYHEFMREVIRKGKEGKKWDEK